MGRYRSFCCLLGLQAGFPLIVFVFVGAQKLPRVKQGWRESPEPVHCDESGPGLTTPVRQRTLKQALQDGLLSPPKGLQPPVPLLPRRKLLFLLLFLNFDFGSCEKWDCNINIHCAGCRVDL